MSEQGLKDEIKRVTKELDDVRADLRAERGEEPAGEIFVTRWGTYGASQTTFHVRLSVNVLDAAKGGPDYVEHMLARMRSEIERELKRRAKG